MSAPDMLPQTPSPFARYKTPLASLAILWGAGGLLLLWLTLSASGKPRVLQPGDTAPAFTLSDQDGHTHSLANYTGRGIVVAFVPGADANSRAQLRSLNAALPQFDALGAKVFAVTAHGPDVTRPLHNTEKLNFPLLTDPQGETGRAFKIANGPDKTGRISYAIGRDGKVLLPVLDIQTKQHGPQMASLLACCLDDATAPVSSAIGKPVADFTLPRVDTAQPATLYGDKTQTATVLLFTSAHCPCSKGYDARVLALSREYGPRHVRFIAVNSARDETATEVAAHARKSNFAFPVLKDAGNAVADTMNAQVTPEVFVMDNTGTLRYHGRIDDSRDPARVTANDLRNALDALLIGKKPRQFDTRAFGCAINRAIE